MDNNLKYNAIGNRNKSYFIIANCHLVIDSILI